MATNYWSFRWWNWLIRRLFIAMLVDADKWLLEQLAANRYQVVRSTEQLGFIIVCFLLNGNYSIPVSINEFPRWCTFYTASSMSVCGYWASALISAGNQWNFECSLFDVLNQPFNLFLFEIFFSCEINMSVYSSSNLNEVQLSQHIIMNRS